MIIITNTFLLKNLHINLFHSKIIYIKILPIIIKYFKIIYKKKKKNLKANQKEQKLKKKIIQNMNL
jgi:hypothetical protein